MLLTQPTLSFWDHLANYFPTRTVSRLIQIAIGIEGLYAAFEATKFALIELPELNHLLETHLIASAELSHVAGKIVLLALSSFLSLYFSVHLAFQKNEVEELIHYALPVIFFVGNGFFLSSFETLHLVEQLGEFIINLWVG